LSDTPEREMADIFWPQGIRPTTGAPRFDPQTPNRIALTPAAVHDSIGYRMNGGPWRVYVTPLAAETAAKIEAKSIRYGWAESPTVVFTQD
jgi:N-sulfoglucosamine sulfohydrolase